MRHTLPLLLLGLATAACATDDTTTSTTDTAAVKVNAQKDGTEPAYVNGVQCKMVFPGALTASTQTYAIWAIGTNGIVYQGDDPSKYNTAHRPNLYAVFGTGASASEVHHVDGYNAYDHYHVLESDPENDEVENTKWDLLVLTPGPNFNPATYHSATSAAEVLAQSAAGILGPVSTPSIFGLPGLVLYSPIKCPQQ